MNQTPGFAFTTEQLEASDIIDGLGVGQTVEFADTGSLRGGYVYRESPERFRFNDRMSVSFVEVCHEVFVR